MKTYKNDSRGFQIDIPDQWSLSTGLLARLFGKDRNPTFNCCRGEAFNFEIGPLTSEPSLQKTTLEFQRFARESSFTDLEFGRITVQSKEHLWARYRIPQRLWTKKYMLVFNGVEYAATASAIDDWTLAEREPVWDDIVRSFRTIGPAT